MSAQKYIIALGLAIIAVIAINIEPASGAVEYAPPNKSHNLTIGNRMPGDRLVLRESIVKNSSWMKIVTVQKTFNATRFERITMVEAVDQKTNGNGAYASVLNGGPGHSNVTMKFKSQRGHGINFVLQLYARP